MSNWPLCFSPINFSCWVFGIFSSLSFQLSFISMALILSEFCPLAASCSKIMNYLISVFHPVLCYRYTTLVTVIYLFFNCLFAPCFLSSSPCNDQRIRVEVWMWNSWAGGHLRSPLFLLAGPSHEGASVGFISYHSFPFFINTKILLGRTSPFPAAMRGSTAVVESHCLSLNPSSATRPSVQTWIGHSSSLCLSFLIITVPTS